MYAILIYAISIDTLNPDIYSCELEADAGLL
jgi:hypothetical protein